MARKRRSPGGSEETRRRAFALRLPLSALALLLVALPTGCSPDELRISSFAPPSGDLESGAAAPASVEVENPGSQEGVFWVGYSVRDARGTWHDAPPTPVEADAGETFPAELSVEGLQEPGYYEARASAWSGEPGGSAERLADASVPAAFRIFDNREDFSSPERVREAFELSSRDLGRSQLEPGNVEAADGELRIALPGGTTDGGEIEARELSGYGFYAARIKVPDAPSSITGFFLYEPPDFEREVDVEVFNDSSGKVMFTTYADGEETNSETVELPFDPTEDFHEYAFDHRPGSIDFYVDGELLRTFDEGLPDDPMRLYINSWFPAWLPGREPGSDRHALVDWIETGTYTGEDR